MTDPYYDHPAYLVIDTIIDEWFDTYDRWMLDTPELLRLKRSLYANVKQYKDLPSNEPKEVKE